jgi:hypothetical protein
VPPCAEFGDLGPDDGSLVLPCVSQDGFQEPEWGTGEDQVGLGDPPTVTPPRDGLGVLTEDAANFLDTEKNGQVFAVLHLVAPGDSGSVVRQPSLISLAVAATDLEHRRQQPVRIARSDQVRLREGALCSPLL